MKGYGNLSFHAFTLGISNSHMYLMVVEMTRRLPVLAIYSLIVKKTGHLTAVKGNAVFFCRKGVDHLSMEGA